VPPDHLILYILLAAVVVLLVTEWIPLEATALLTMGTLALTGLVPAEDALAGFSSPAVITIWAVFILSGALDRTGVAERIGRGLKRLAGRTEIGLTTVLMLGAGLMSAVMNNIAVAALLLPVTMDLARANHIPPSRLLLPLAYGCLLGGLTTMIGTPPNILVSNALKEAGLTPFGLFDFTPIGAVILLAGTAFMVFGGRLLLPRRDVASAAARSVDDLPGQYHLQERTFALTLPFNNPLVGRTLADSRLGAATGLYVVAVIRGEQTSVAPSPEFALRAGDRLYVQGRLERFYDVQALVNLIVAEKSIDLEWFAGKGLVLAEISLPEGSALIGRPLADASIRCWRRAAGTRPAPRGRPALCPAARHDPEDRRPPSALRQSQGNRRIAAGKRQVPTEQIARYPSVAGGVPAQ
jgi:di/tricarboxylate transporter